MAKKIKPLETPDLKQTLTPALLGAAIKARRTQNNLRLEDAAALCGVAKETLVKIERGQHANRLESVLQVCTALGVKLFIAPWKREVNDDWR